MTRTASHCHSTDREMRFWTWLSNHSDDLPLCDNGEFERNAPETIACLTDDCTMATWFITGLNTQLRQVNPSYTCRITRLNAGSERALVVGSEGDPHIIPTIRDFVRRAPLIPGWKVYAFRPPWHRGPFTDLPHECPLPTGDIWFSMNCDPANVSLTLFVDDLKRFRPAEAPHLPALLELLLGEQLQQSRRWSFLWEQHQGDPENVGLLPLTELPFVISGSDKHWPSGMISTLMTSS